MGISLTANMARFVFSHSEKQLKYMEDKQRLLGTESRKYRTVKMDDDYGKRVLVQAHSAASLYCKGLYNELYFDGVKCVKKEYLDQLNEVSLAAWYMDDGSYCNGLIQISTHGFSYDENLLIQEFFKNRWCINFKVMVDSRCNKPYLVAKARRDGERFLYLVSRYVANYFKYKIGNHASGGFNYFEPLQGKEVEHKEYSQEDFIFQGVGSIVSESRPTFALEVEDNHDYFADGILIHD
jgi:hypothetical protein